MKQTFAIAAIAATVLAIAPAQAKTMIYNVDPAAQCSQSASSLEKLDVGLAYCDEALSDPVMLHRGGLTINRGIIKFAMGDTAGAMADFNEALLEAPDMGDGYINRASLLIALGRTAEARADLAKAMELGAANISVAYYNRAVIEDEAADYPAAYRDYKQALALKPDYAAAARELGRFKVSASAN